MDSDLIEQACRLEVRLLDPTTRSQPALVSELLHPDFVEHGSSGRRWTRDEIVVALSSEHDMGPVETFDLSGSRLSDGIVLVTYRSVRGERHAWRSSIWVREAGQWQVLFHQATPIYRS